MQNPESFLFSFEAWGSEVLIVYIFSFLDRVCSISCVQSSTIVKIAFLHCKWQLKEDSKVWHSQQRAWMTLNERQMPILLRIPSFDNGSRMCTTGIWILLEFKRCWLLRQVFKNFVSMKARSEDHDLEYSKSELPCGIRNEFSSISWYFCFYVSREKFQFKSSFALLSN